MKFPVSEKDWSKIKKFFPTQYKYYRNDSKNYIIPNGESYNQVTKRTMDSLIDIIENHKNQKVVIVTHGGVISPLIRDLLSIPYETHRKFMISNTSITKLVYNEFGFSILSLGDIAHLEGEKKVLDEMEAWTDNEKDDALAVWAHLAAGGSPDDVCRR